MKNKNFYILIIIALFILLIIGNQKYVLAEYNCKYLESDKRVYYPDEIIKLNSSWDLSYENNSEGYIQIKIFNAYNEIIWNSSKYSEKGFSFYEEWNINISTLNLIYVNKSCSLTITFYYFKNDGWNIVEDFSNAIEVSIIKKSISHQCNYKKTIECGENFLVNSTFFYYSLDGIKMPLMNHKIIFQLNWNSSIIFNLNLTTDIWGMLIFNLSKYIELKIGNTTLNFLIEENQYFNSHKFNVTVQVLKENILCHFPEDLNKIEYGESLLLYPNFYKLSLNGNEIPLVNHKIHFQIFWNDSLIYNSNFTTDETGTIELNLTTDNNHMNYGKNDLVFSIEEEDSIYSIQFKYVLDIEKTTVYKKVIRLNESEIPFQNIELEIFYYFYYNGKITPLKEAEIKVIIYYKEIKIMQAILKTNKSGYLNTQINLTRLNKTLSGQSINIKLIYNGSEILRNDTFIRNYNFKGNISHKRDLSPINNILIIIFSALSIIISFVSINIILKRKKKIKVSEIIIRI